MPTSRFLSLCLAVALLATGCGDDSTANEPDQSIPTSASTPGGDDPVLVDASSPVGGTVKELVIPGPETSVLVACDQEGFEPFLFADQGVWVGCQITAGEAPGDASTLLEPAMSDAASPVGETVKELVIPGPEISVLVACDQEGFEPFLFADQGTWVGCSE
jgi:hypothetical protein